MSFSVLDDVAPERIKEIESFMWEDEHNLRLYPAKVIKKFLTQNELQFFCWHHGLYQLPTTELMEILEDIFIGYDRKDIIEIGAGAGQIGRRLGIKMTDSKLQETEMVNAIYNIVKQPTCKYHPEVIQAEASMAVNMYRPRIVLGCWVTEKPKNWWGIDESGILHQIEFYVVVGNKYIHDKAIFKKYQTIEMNFGDVIVSRASRPNANRIWVVRK